MGVAVAAIARRYNPPMTSSAPPPTILLFGASGQVGHVLASTLLPLGCVKTCTRAQLDLSVAEGLQERIERIVSEINPTVIVNASAYTAVDKAESEPDMAQLVNATAPGWMAQAAARHGAVLVHYSTDYVFRGDKDGAYVETDPVGPLSVYGKTKLEGEQAVAAACPRHLIFRTSWVFGVHGGNFLKTMLRLARERDALSVVADQFGSPTSASLIAQTTASVLSQMLHAPATDPRWGIYHLVAGGETNWHAYATHVIERARQSGVPIRVAPGAISRIASKDYPVPAPRPSNSRMDTLKLRQAFGVSLPDWQDGVDQVLEQLLKSDE